MRLGDLHRPYCTRQPYSYPGRRILSSFPTTHKHDRQTLLREDFPNTTSMTPTKNLNIEINKPTNEIDFERGPVNLNIMINQSKKSKMELYKKKVNPLKMKK